MTRPTQTLIISALLAARRSLEGVQCLPCTDSVPHLSEDLELVKAVLRGMTDA